ncbi:AAA family ATPase [Aeromonas caviae]|uniref:AAA family ATPase n=1 Tax=Aeromonas caviae TaxID=648 RepID=UPI00387396BE
MKAIRIKNLRCFNDTGYIEIKPINLLIGLNSTGKSSFARVFPLLKQSIERYQVLYYGMDHM